MPDRDRGLFGPSGRQLAYAFGILLIIALLPLASPKQHRTDPGEPQQASASQERAGRQPVSISSSGEDGPSNASQARDERAQDQPIGTLRWLVQAALDPDNFANFLIMLFTLALTVVGVLEFLLLRRSTEESAMAVEIARQTAEATGSVASGTVATGAATLALANAAERSADMAAKTLAATQELAYRQLRAYLFVTQAKITATRKGDLFILAIDLPYRNSGQTPAEGISIHSVNVFVETPSFNADPSKSGAPDTEHIIFGGHFNSLMTLGPSDIGRLEIPAMVPAEWIETDFSNPYWGAAITVTGKIAYRDYTGREWVEPFLLHTDAIKLKAGPRPQEIRFTRGHRRHRGQ
jgi:hypothetical protein